MFCPKCGTKAIEGADFCQKCGAKLIKENKIERPIAFPEPVTPVVHAQQPSASIHDVELTVSCAKIRCVFPGTVFPLLVDDVPVGEVPNNGAFTYRITPGPHRIKVNRSVIGINIPEGETTVTLNLQHGKFICSSNNIVTEPSSIEQVSFSTMLKNLNAVSIAGLVFIALSVIGVIVVSMIPIGFSTLDYRVAMLVGVLILAAAGTAFLLLSPKTRKVKAKGIVLGLVSAIAVGAVIIIASSAVSFLNWNRMVYVNAVKNTRPFDTAENNRYWRSVLDVDYFFSPNYDDVFSCYIDSIEWITINRDRGLVDVTGRLKGTDDQITVHFDAHFVAPYKIVLAETSLTGDEEISTFIYNMFDAYVKGEDYAPDMLMLQAPTDAEATDTSTGTADDGIALSGSTIRFDTEFYSLELPEYWADLCVYSQWDIEPYSYGITFYENQSCNDFGGEGGELFSLALYRSDVDEYYDFPDYLYLGELAVIRLARYDVVATFPTDVQFSEAGQENYLRLREDIDDILASFTPQSDPECEYTPAA